jgi:hypothetical protein
LLNWHPTINAQIRELGRERREQESERRTKLIEKDSERLEKENKRLADIEFRFDALLLSADSSSPIPPNRLQLNEALAWLRIAEVYG